MGQRPGEADDPGLGGDHMRAIFGTGMRAQPADIDDGPAAGLPQRRQAGLDAVEGAVERNVHDLAPLGIAHLRERLFPPQRCVVDEDIDPAELLDGGVRHRLY